MRGAATKILLTLSVALSLLWSTKAKEKVKPSEIDVEHVLLQPDALTLNDDMGNILAQKRDRTAAQCRADAGVWKNADMFDEYLKAEDLHRDPHKPNNNSTELARLPLTEVLARLREMTECENLDPKNIRLYNDANYVYMHVWGDRMVNFLGRHDLWEQFQKEDAEGKR